tara:strand:- start:3411 stop:4619 length:1209 start_codon:yes stop_codon:yes gene_type:complete
MRNSKGFFLSLTVILLPISYVVDSYLSYYDEIFVLGYLIYVVIFHLKSFLTNHKWILLFIIMLYLFGLLSNFYSNYTYSNFSILVDIFTGFKQFLIFIIMCTIVTKRDKRDFIKSLVWISKAYLVLASLFALLSQFIDLGMTNDLRYGMKSFAFLSGNNSGFGITIILCLLILAASNIRMITFFTYFLIGGISLILTTKGVIYSFLTFFIIIFMFSNKSKLRKRDFILLISSLIAVSSFQLNEYLLNNNSPRMYIIISAYHIAGDNFPLGSGFASFGGDQARINYSPLYIKYGFENIYGLSKKQDMFLNDNYLGMILAQIGYLGLLFYCIILGIIFQLINKDSMLNFRLKNVMLSALLMLIISSIATGIIKTPNGVLIFAILGILLSHKFSNIAYYNENENN